MSRRGTFILGNGSDGGRRGSGSWITLSRQSLELEGRRVQDGTRCVIHRETLTQRIPVTDVTTHLLGRRRAPVGHGHEHCPIPFSGHRRWNDFHAPAPPCISDAIADDRKEHDQVERNQESLVHSSPLNLATMARMNPSDDKAVTSVALRDNHVISRPLTGRESPASLTELRPNVLRRTFSAI